MARRAYRANFQRSYSALLRMAGDSPTFIIGDGDFNRPGSLHGRWLRGFASVALAHGAQLFKEDESWTSLKCPDCPDHPHRQWINMRVAYCRGCNRYFHRDKFAARNIAQLGMGSLWGFPRPQQYTFEWNAAQQELAAKTKA